MSIATWCSARRGISGDQTTSPGLLRAYRLTQYRADGVPIRIGRRSAALDDLLRRAQVRSGVLLSAWNPLSRRMPGGWNRRAERRLAAWLRRHRTRPADGRLGRWQEAHVLLLGDPRPGLGLARRFRQRAVVLLMRGRAPRLVLLGRSGGPGWPKPGEGIKSGVFPDT
jgi:hypothetical protein